MGSVLLHHFSKSSGETKEGLFAAGQTKGFLFNSLFSCHYLISSGEEEHCTHECCVKAGAFSLSDSLVCQS